MSQSLRRSRDGFRTFLSRLVTLTSRSRLGLETQMSRDLAPPETSSTSRASFQPNTNCVELKFQLSQKSGSLDNALFILLKMTKLHSAKSQVINTQHGLRFIRQLPATPVMCTGKLSTARTSEKQVGLLYRWA